MKTIKILHLILGILVYGTEIALSQGGSTVSWYSVGTSGSYSVLPNKDIHDFIAGIIAPAETVSTSNGLIVTQGFLQPWVDEKTDKLVNNVELEKIYGVHVRNALSPNGDGENDVLIIDGIENYPVNMLDVFNENNDKTSHTTIKNYDNHDRVLDLGKYKNSQTLFYILRFFDPSIGRELVNKGYITIIK